MDIENTSPVGSPRASGQPDASSSKGIKRARTPELQQQGNQSAAVTPPRALKVARREHTPPEIRLQHRAPVSQDSPRSQAQAADEAAHAARRRQLLDALPAAMLEWEVALGQKGYVEAPEDSPYEQSSDFYAGACALAQGRDSQGRFVDAQDAIDAFKDCASDPSDLLPVRLAACHNLLVVAEPHGEVALQAAQQACELLRNAPAVPDEPYAAGLLVRLHATMARHSEALTPQEKAWMPTLLDQVLHQLQGAATNEALTLLPLHYLSVYEHATTPTLRERVAQAASPQLPQMQMAVHSRTVRGDAAAVPKDHTSLTLYAVAKLSSVHLHLREGRGAEVLRRHTGTLAADAPANWPLADWLEVEGMSLAAELACGSAEVAALQEVIASIPRRVSDCTWAHAQPVQPPHGGTADDFRVVVQYNLVVAAATGGGSVPGAVRTAYGFVRHLDEGRLDPMSRRLAARLHGAAARQWPALTVSERASLRERCAARVGDEAFLQETQADLRATELKDLVPPPRSLDSAIARFGPATTAGEWAVRPLQYLDLLESAGTPEAQAAIAARAALDFEDMSSAVRHVGENRPSVTMQVPLLLAQFALAKLGTRHILSAGLDRAAPIYRATETMIDRLKNLPQHWIAPQRLGMVPADEVWAMAPVIVEAKRLGRSLDALQRADMEQPQ